MKSKDKLKFLITAGPSREYIDPVRFISNASSGKMGYALAAAAASAGHKVTLISSCGNLRSPAGVKIIPVESAREIFEAVRENFPKCNYLIMASAVADYTPAKIYRSKIKKSDSDLIIRLKPTVDVLKWAAAHR
ncbi:MAG: phosphopantothenoylcysteine decarboxylase, partial [Planctomycetes bacterium]|nr:phosphopantothenoylcysteine decarboxylase [Planctomycetota bacterium]